jgi:hypothetical protein
LNVLGSGRLEQTKFAVRASGSVTTGASLTVLPVLYMALVIPGTPFTAANWTVLASGTARTVATTTCPWMIEAYIEFESVGGTMQGTFGATVNNLTDAQAALPNLLTGLNGTPNSVTQGSTLVVAAEPVFVVACGITFGTANAGNKAVLGSFTLDC